ncbi:hypothetical protein ACFL2V_20025 [Pseudomonadota bacterium]
MKFIALVIGAMVLFLLAPVLVVSFIKAPYGLEIKIIIFTALLFLFTIIVLLFNVVEKLVSIELFTRANFIATETKRLEPQNNKTAMNILKSDLEEERDMDKFLGNMGAMSTAKQWLIVVTLQGGLIYAVLRFWPEA